MQGRPYTKKDMRGMKDALALLTAYDMGTEPNEFREYAKLKRESNHQTTEHMTQLAWLLLRSIEASSGTSKEELLDWYGKKFATLEMSE